MYVLNKIIYKLSEILILIKSVLLHLWNNKILCLAFNFENYNTKLYLL